MVDDNAPIGQDGGMRCLPLLLFVGFAACGDEASTPVAPSVPGLMRDVQCPTRGWTASSAFSASATAAAWAGKSTRLTVSSDFTVDVAT